MSNSQELAVNVQTKELNLNADDIKKYIAPNATDKELYFFINIAKSYGLNPFKREVHFCKYGNSPGQVIVGYETYIKRAERTGQLDGWSVWTEKDGIGEKAVIEINRKDRTHPFRWEVYREEFDKKQSTWKAMPYFMLKKVAISQGFRLAFPEEIGGMPYTPDEINGQASENLPKGEVLDTEYTSQAHKGHSQLHTEQQTQHSGQQSEQQPKSQNTGAHDPNLASMSQLKKLATVMTNLGIEDRETKLNQVNTWLENKGFAQVSSSKELTRDQAMQLIDELEGKGEDPFAPETQEEANATAN